MIEIHDIAALKAWSAERHKANKTIAFVPTMGNLHSGHMSLIDHAQTLADEVVCSIFVNPTQFGENEDLDAYPKTLSDDIDKLKAHGCHVLFIPSAHDMYPQPDLTRVTVHHMSTLHCGATRPGHFNGVTTVVLKLVNALQPHFAIFGLKDFQQYTILKTMLSDLFVPTQIVGVETGRAEDGLAHSSRNGYLTAIERETAPCLYATLCTARQHLEAGIKPVYEIVREAKEFLMENGLTPDYFSICRQIDLEPATEQDTELVILAAAYLGRARLIDNLHFHLNR
jgi:pantoate--beta-alanine ligase